MNTLIPSPASQELTRSRRIGVVIYPDCDIVDVCGPCDAFHYAEIILRRFGRINEPATYAISWPPPLDRFAQVVESSLLRPTVTVT
jgi:hypothetical protein